MKILTRYVLREHVGPFLAALGVLTTLMLVNQLARRLGELAGKGLPAQVIAEVFGLSFPFILAMTVPMAVLVAVLYAFGRLSADNELTALKASGVGLRRLCLPVILAAAGVSIFMIWFSDRIVPESNHSLRKLLVDIGQKKPTFNLREQMVNEVVPGRLFLRAAKIDRSSNRLYDVVIYDLGARDLTRTIYANSGHLAFNETRTDLYLTLYDGQLYEVDFRDPQASQVAEFSGHVVRAPGVQDELERGRGGEFRGDREMNVKMMRQRVDSARANWRVTLDSARALTERALSIARRSHDPPPAHEDARAPNGLGPEPALDAGRADTTAGALLRALRRKQLPRPETARTAGTPGARAVEVPATSAAPRRDRERTEPAARKAAFFAARYREHALRAQLKRREMNRYLVEIHKKFAIPMAAIVFALVGAPIGARFPRGGIGMVLLVSLLVFNVYYVGLIGGEDLADRGVITPFWGMWAPNVLFFLLGAFLLYREGRQSATARGGRREQLFDLIRQGAATLRRRRRAGGR